MLSRSGMAFMPATIAAEPGPHMEHLIESHRSRMKPEKPKNVGHKNRAQPSGYRSETTRDDSRSDLFNSDYAGLGRIWSSLAAAGHFHLS